MATNEFLQLLGLAYGAVMTGRRRAYAKGWLPRARLDVPVLSVGALLLGGAGKTPLAIHLARRLASSGRRVGIVHSGYRGSAGRQTLRVEPDAAGACVGDEALLLARAVPSAIVTRGADKVQAARLAVELGADLLLLDDGFQHLRLQRDLDIVLVDTVPAAPLPGGRAREAASAALAADLRWFHGRAGEAPPHDLDVDVVSRSAVDSVVTHRGVFSAGPHALRGQRVFLLAGIARPEAFRRLVEAQGAIVCGTAFVHDHQRLPPAASWRARARAADADVLLCTEKDLARHADDELCGLHALRVRVDIVRGEERLAAALAGCGCG